MFEQAEEAMSNLLAKDVQQGVLLEQVLNHLDEIYNRIDDILGRLQVLEDGEVVEPSVDVPFIKNDTKSWELVWSDGFIGDALNEDNWALSYWWDWKIIGSTNEGTGELQWYTLGDNIEVYDSKVHLIARKEQVTGERKGTPTVFNYTSAIITTGKPRRGVAEKFPFRYGFVEIKAKVPRGQGLWPAFWMLPVDEQSRPEIDIFEFLGHETSVDRLHMHYLDSSGQRRDPGKHYEVEGVDFADDFHIYGLDWSPGYLRWYVDGELAWEITDYVPQEDMYVLLNLAVGGRYPGAPDETTVFPAEFVVDYMKIWK